MYTQRTPHIPTGRELPVLKKATQFVFLGKNTVPFECLQFWIDGGRGILRLREFAQRGCKLSSGSLLVNQFCLVHTVIFL